ncbi:hypothetical protein EON67_02895 [archaeon]|nr:MAG: hypothetical protein EON67_02895 [archaeon]
MATVGDSTQHLSILTDRGVRIMATRFDGAVLVMHVSADAGEQHVYEQAGMRLTVLQRVCSIQARIRRQGSGGTGASSMASGSLVGIMDPDFENVGPSMMATIT